MPKQTSMRRLLPNQPLPWFLLAITTLLVSFAIGIYLISTYSVRIVIEQSAFQVRTAQRTVGALLDELAVPLEPQDRLSLARDTPLSNGLTLYIDKAERVVLEYDGQQRQFLTHQKEALAILREAGVSFGEHDQVLVDGLPLSGTAQQKAPRHVRVVRARPVQVRDGDQVPITLFTTALTVGEALHAARIGLYVADRVSPAVSAPLEPDRPIAIQRSVPFSIIVDGRVLASRSAARTVGEALAEAGIALIGLDYCLPEESAPLVSNMTIRVVRVTEADEIERSEIDFQQVFQPDTGIPPETQKVIQAGVKGILERRVRVRREDGVEVSRSLPYTVIVRDPRHEVIAIGATPALLTPEPTNTPLPPAAPGS
jgi:uncharacterized protein YabE (DUF348 family)